MASFMRPSALAASQAAFSLSRPAMRTTLQQQLSRQGRLMGVAGFHASSRRQILKPLPQVVKGTPNDPAPVPPTSPTHGSYHWTFERLIAASLIPLTIAPFAGGSLNPVMDAVLCGALVIHSHIGFQACIVDYFPGWRVPKTRTFLNWLLRAATLTAAVGLYEFETNDVGLTEAVKRVWTA